MEIYIDESGNFVRPPAGELNLSCVGALIIPDFHERAVTSRFEALKRRWGEGGEIKGSRLSDRQVEAVVDLLIGCECLFFVGATEMSVNDDAVMAAYQREQAAEFSVPATAEAHPMLRTQLNALRAAFEQMPAQLFLQTVVLTDLLKKVIDVATLHFAMTRPAEAGAFRWVIDGKDATKTRYEAAWELMAGGLIQGRCIENPGVMAKEGNYTHFERFFVTDRDWPQHLPPPRTRDPRRPGKMLNLSKILHESLRFADSEATVGLQLADIVTNGFRRAMMGRLHPRAYRRMGNLMVYTGRSPFELHLFAPAGTTPEIDEYTDPHTLLKSRSRFVGTPLRR
jgi:hypothetical protein